MSDYNPIAFDHTHVLYDPNDILGLVSVFFTLLPIFVMVFYLSWFLLTREIQPVVIVGGHIINELFNHVLKKVFRQPRPAFHENFGKGRIDANAPPQTIFNSLSYGMPSAHSQFMGYFMIFWALTICYQWKGLNTHKKVAGCLTLFGTTVGVVSSRVYLWYHTVEQVAVGVSVGACVGAVYFIIACLARQYGLVGWVLNWPVVKYFYVKDSFYLAPLSFEDEYRDMMLRVAKSGPQKKRN
ncbi:hypothetical protein BABINDRAFT_163868 [Babjeviella inositovora NRRL Y-12698]|uniref:Dolichyldiphosphatase n=1 Tax=Babjeviella inositovora NRRL Y-12698 TaxID=984486 RepID=A0A1E3QHH6_9ASCO|nr:uncharacterized protein BABINDRAFT_163868 [Babjeviella inositovora NRRL Y-12698]ODQ77141.1 hypothetical protein BABINDRAFT_163868 [Babjeviella inositovora NRRL Y-12698]